MKVGPATVEVGCLGVDEAHLVDEEQPEEVAQGVEGAVGVRENALLAVTDCVGVLLAETLPQGEGEGVPTEVADAQALAMPVVLGVPGARLPDGGADAQALALPPRVGLGVVVSAEEGVALADTVIVGQGGLGEALAVAWTLLVGVENRVAVGEAEAQAHTEGVKEAEGEASAVAVALANSTEPVLVTEAVPQALALPSTLEVSVVLALTELLMHREKAAVAVAHWVAERVELEVREAQREALTLALAVPHPLTVGEAEGQRVPLPVALALKESEGVPVGACRENERRAEEERVHCAKEGLPVPDAHGVGDCVDASDAERDAAGEGQGLELPVPVPPSLAEEEGAAV